MEPQVSKRPPYLFKYTPFSNLEHVMLRNHLRFSAPESFNDPFDCAIHPSFSYTPEQYRQHYDQMLRETMPKMNRAERRREISQVKPDKMLLEEAFDIA